MRPAGWRRAALVAFVLVGACLPAAAQAPGGGVADDPVRVSSLPVRQGARGADVRQIQARLQELGFYRGAVDGVFGPLTAEAVRRFQEARGLPAVGYVGPRTLEALNRPEPPAGNPPSAPSPPAAGRLPLPPPEEGEAAGGGGPGGGGRLALTFDDGPDPAVLPGLLDVLRQHQARATFFVLGRLADQHPDLVKRVAAEGHQVENHGYTHRRAESLSPRELRQEIERTAAAIRRATGRSPRFYRPAGGGFTPDTARASGASGHRLVLWTNVGSPDVPFPGQEELVARLTRAAFDGAIVMLHADRPETVRALPGVLAAWKAAGLRLVTLDELVSPPGTPPRDGS